MNLESHKLKARDTHHWTFSFKLTRTCTEVLLVSTSSSANGRTPGPGPGPQLEDSMSPDHSNLIE
jgi:hypothetical protein